MAEGSVWVCCGAEGWGSRGQASELTDLGDYIKTTHLSIIGRREDVSKERTRFEREYLHRLASCRERALRCLSFSLSVNINRKKYF